jgi:hypothetical protein
MAEEMSSVIGFPTPDQEEPFKVDPNNPEAERANDPEVREFSSSNHPEQGEVLGIIRAKEQPDLKTDLPIKSTPPSRELSLGDYGYREEMPTKSDSYLDPGVGHSENSVDDGAPHCDAKVSVQFELDIHVSQKTPLSKERSDELTNARLTRSGPDLHTHALRVRKAASTHQDAQRQLIWIRK